MKLLLTSNGIDESFEKEFMTLLKKNPEQLSVAFITTAAYGEGDNPVWLNIYRKQLQKYAITDIEDLDLKNKTKQELEKVLENKDIIFVNGGNTFYLLEWVRKSGFSQILKTLLEKEVLYVGVSAGSIIACPTIESAGWEPADENKVALKELTALNIVQILIAPHFKEEYLPTIKFHVQKSKYPVIAINDTQAILVSTDGYKIIGRGEEIIFN